MPRKRRQELAGGIHHVTSHGNRELAMFHDDAHRRGFLLQLALTAGQREWLILGWCLMTTHLHLVVQTQLPNLGEGMRDLLATHARSFNDQIGEPGKLVRAPFFSNIIDSDQYFATATRYVACNPCTAFICDDPADYGWSSHRLLLGGADHPLAACSRVEELLACWGAPYGERYATLLAPRGRFGTWADATDPLPPRPRIAELFASLAVDEAIKAARAAGYLLREIAEATGLSEATISRRARP